MEPPRHKDRKVHEEFFVRLRAFEPWWQTEAMLYSGYGEAEFFAEVLCGTSGVLMSSAVNLPLNILKPRPLGNPQINPIFARLQTVVFLIYPAKPSHPFSFFLVN
jgi:hypothetical protein